MLVVGVLLAVTYAIAKALDLTIGLRVDDEVEAMGIDLREHAETAYTPEPASVG